MTPIALCLLLAAAPSPVEEAAAAPRVELWGEPHQLEGEGRHLLGEVEGGEARLQRLEELRPLGGRYGVEVPSHRGAEGRQ